MLGTDVGPPAAASVSPLDAGGARIEPVDAGIGVLVGLAPEGPVAEPVLVGSLAEFARTFGAPGGGSLGHAVRGVFTNGGRSCWVVRAAGAPGTATLAAHLAALDALERASGASLAAVPDAHALAGGLPDALAVQAALVERCERAADLLAVLEPPPGASEAAVLAWRRRGGLDTPAAVVVHPWLRTLCERSGEPRAVPPCGHALGIHARVASADGVHRTPTNEVALGVEDLAAVLGPDAQRALNRAGVTCLRRWPGDETRLWGGATLSGDPDWRYVGARRLVTHVAASIQAGTAWAAGRAGDEAVREAVRRAAHAFVAGLHAEGTLPGTTPGEAFWVRCPPDPGGALVIEVGIAVRVPRRFKLVRVVHALAPAS